MTPSRTRTTQHSPSKIISTLMHTPISVSPCSPWRVRAGLRLPSLLWQMSQRLMWRPSVLVRRLNTKRKFQSYRLKLITLSRHWARMTLGLWSLLASAKVWAICSMQRQQTITTKPSVVHTILPTLWCHWKTNSQVLRILPSMALQHGVTAIGHSFSTVRMAEKAEKVPSGVLTSQAMMLSSMSFSVLRKPLNLSSTSL